MEGAGIPSLAAWVWTPDGYEVIGLLVLGTDHGTIFECETKGIVVHHKASHASPEELPDRLEMAWMLPDAVDSFDAAIGLHDLRIAADGDFDAAKIEQNSPGIHAVSNQDFTGSTG